MFTMKMKINKRYKIKGFLICTQKKGFLINDI